MNRQYQDEEELKQLYSEKMSWVTSWMNRILRAESGTHREVFRSPFFYFSQSPSSPQYYISHSQEDRPQANRGSSDWRMVVLRCARALIDFSTELLLLHSCRVACQGVLQGTNERYIEVESNAELARLRFTRPTKGFKIKFAAKRE